MKIEDSFRVSCPVEETWKVLLDIERIAPCLPGAQLQEVEGDEYRGIVKVKVGPITAQYKGAAKLEEVDEAQPQGRARRPRAATRAGRATRRPRSSPRWCPTATAPRSTSTPTSRSPARSRSSAAACWPTCRASCSASSSRTSSATC